VLYNVNQTRIEENNLTKNNGYGISIASGSENSIIDNLFNANGVERGGGGLGLGSSMLNTVHNNTFIDDGLHIGVSLDNSVENNTVNGRPLVYLEGVSDVEVEDAGQIVLVNCRNMTVENLNLTHTGIGLILYGTDESTIKGNLISFNDVYGIQLQHSSDNIVMYNTIMSNNYPGILFVNSSRNLISYNDFDSGVGAGISMYLTSNDNRITHNNFTSNRIYNLV